MKHKFNTIPSKSFLRAALKRYFNQRVTFTLDPTSKFMEFLKEDHKFDPAQPVVTAGILRGITKHGNSSPSQIEMLFNDISFEQGGKTVYICSDRQYSKRMWWSFELTEMRGIGFADYMNSLIPKLPYTQALPFSEVEALE
jgi:hypothetical protein